MMMMMMTKAAEGSTCWLWSPIRRRRSEEKEGIGDDAGSTPLLDIDTHCINGNGPVDFIVHVDLKV